MPRNTYSYDATYQGSGQDIIYIDNDGVSRGKSTCTRKYAMLALRQGSQLYVNGRPAHISYTRVPQPDGSTVPGYMSDMSTAIPF